MPVTVTDEVEDLPSPQAESETEQPKPNSTIKVKAKRFFNFFLFFAPYFILLKAYPRDILSIIIQSKNKLLILIIILVQYHH